MAVVPPDGGGAPPEAEVQRVLEAAQRWRDCAPEREARGAALRSGRLVDADSPARLAKWVERRQEWASVLAGLHDQPPQVPAARTPPVTADQITDQLVERVVGETRDLLSIEFFELGLVAARCVGRVVTSGEANGTGFLVAPGLMLTNEHVLPDAETAAASELELDFEANRVGAPKQVQVFALEPQRFFLARKEFDFALVGIALTSSSGEQLDSFKILPLIGEEGKVRIGEAVNIVQHPGGRAKQVVIRNNRLVDLPEGDDLRPYFHYEADTERGSSGSPVFNDFWEVVALHHTAVPATNERNELVDREGQVLREHDTARFWWIANEGIRVSRIVEEVRTAGDLSPGMVLLRDEALRTWSLRGLPSVAEAQADDQSILVPQEEQALGAEAVRDPARARDERSQPLRDGRPAVAVQDADAVDAHAPQAAASSDGSVLEFEVPLRVRISLGAVAELRRPR